MITIVNLVKRVKFNELETGDLFTFDLMAEDTYSLPPIWMKTTLVSGTGAKGIVSMEGEVDWVNNSEEMVYPLHGELSITFEKE